MTSPVRSYFFPVCGSNYDRDMTPRVRSYFSSHTGDNYDTKGWVR